MGNVISGMDALNALNDDGGNGSGSEFTKFGAGSKFLVKVIGKEIELSGKPTRIGDFISYYNYGIYKKVNSFVAANPSKKSAKGYPVESLTVWDKAWKYHADLSKEFQDFHSKEAYKYKPAQKFVFGFFDLDAGKQIVIDLTKNQAIAVNNAIKKYGKKVDKIAFELTKEGSGTNTVVALTPVLDMDEDITDKQRANFEKAPQEFDMKLFEGLLYEVDEANQIQLLTQAGFDVSLIGLEAHKQDAVRGDVESLDGQLDISDDDLPF